MPSGEDAFSNPLAPPGETVTAVEEKPSKLTNADFRKLMMTPRASSAGKRDSSETPGDASTRSEPSATQRRDNKDDARAQERRKKKSYYAKIKKEEEEKMAELAEKYRDRARERRDGKNPDYQAEDPNQAGMGGYRAVAPDLKSGLDAAERRKQMIQESKFLGGDMEHTHLVKGLDYALLQKVRSEIHLKEAEVIEYRQAPTTDEAGQAENVAAAEEAAPVPPPAVVPPPTPVIKEKKTQPEEEDIIFKTNAGRRLYTAITMANSAPEFNDLFLPGRMAYAIDLDDDATESDIPTTVIRSKADLQGIENMQATFTTNDIVIQKLTQILSYLRTGKANKKGKKKDKGKNDNTGKGGLEDSIYPELGDYVPAKVNDKEKDRGREHERERGRDREKDKDRRDRDRDYHGKERDRERGRDRTDRENDRDAKRKSYFETSVHEEVEKELRAAEERLQTEWPTGADVLSDKQPPPPQQQQQQGQSLQGPQKGTSKFYDDDYYTECYPGMAEMQDAIDDSDDEADYTKMDMGNKKGPVGRWDFDTQEEYSDYMNQREAMPKAAFQYGVKMADGRKTRRIGGNKEKDRNAELNREWQQIQQILKRRGDKEGSGGGAEKSARYEY